MQAYLSQEANKSVLVVVVSVSVWHELVDASLVDLVCLSPEVSMLASVVVVVDASLGPGVCSSLVVSMLALVVGVFELAEALVALGMV